MKEVIQVKLKIVKRLFDVYKLSLNCKKKNPLWYLATDTQSLISQLK